MKHIPEWKKQEYWNHFIERMYVEGYGGGHGITGPRLRKVKSMIWINDNFWGDIIARHGAHNLSPRVLRDEFPETYGHCLGNFWGWIADVMVEQGMLK